jgi:hypothetical protein
VTFRRTFGKALVLDLADIAEPADPIYGDMALVSPLQVPAGSCTCVEEKDRLSLSWT